MRARSSPRSYSSALVKAVWAALRPLEMGLHEAEQVVCERYAALGDRVRRGPSDSLDGPSLANRVEALPGRALADHCGAPVHFASPYFPDDEAPRWQGDHSWQPRLARLRNVPDRPA